MDTTGITYNGLTIEECERAFGHVTHKGERITITLVIEGNRTAARCIGANDKGNLFLVTWPVRPIEGLDLIGDTGDFTVDAI